MEELKKKLHAKGLEKAEILKKLIKDIMTPASKAITASQGVTLKQAEEILQDHKIELLCVYNSSKGLFILIFYLHFFKWDVHFIFSIFKYVRLFLFFRFLSTSF